MVFMAFLKPYSFGSVLRKGIYIYIYIYGESIKMCICLSPEFDCPEVTCVVDRTLKSNS